MSPSPIEVPTLLITIKSENENAVEFEAELENKDVCIAKVRKLTSCIPKAIPQRTAMVFKSRNVPGAERVQANEAIAKKINENIWALKKYFCFNIFGAINDPIMAPTERASPMSPRESDIRENFTCANKVTVPSIPKLVME